jgi:NADH-quinone oxidoreductase subunit C
MYNYNVFIKYPIKEGHTMPSLIKNFASSNWAEREVWDLFGLYFTNHPDLRRLVTDYGFQGHALRKDFPLTGFYEIYYNDGGKLILYEPVELAQELRQTALKLNSSSHSLKQVIHV